MGPSGGAASAPTAHSVQSVTIRRSISYITSAVHHLSTLTTVNTAHK